MFLPALLLAFVSTSPTPDLARSTVCHNIATVAAPELWSKTNFRVTLSVHTEDDHGKETHLCQSDYTLKIFHPDGTQSAAEGFFGNDDAWDRPISFRLAGFSQSGSSALIVITEGGPYPIDELIVYDLEANTWEIADLAGALKSQLSAACLTGVRVVGTTPAGDAVVAPAGHPGCDASARFQVTVADSTTGNPLAEPAKRLAGSSAAILPLDPGVAAKP